MGDFDQALDLTRETHRVGAGASRRADAVRHALRARRGVAGEARLPGRASGIQRGAPLGEQLDDDQAVAFADLRICEEQIRLGQITAARESCAAAQAGFAAADVTQMVKETQALLARPTSTRANMPLRWPRSTACSTTRAPISCRAGCRSCMNCAPAPTRPAPLRRRLRRPAPVRAAGAGRDRRRPRPQRPRAARTLPRRQRDRTQRLAEARAVAEQGTLRPAARAAAAPHRGHGGRRGADRAADLHPGRHPAPAPAAAHRHRGQPHQAAQPAAHRRARHGGVPARTRRTTSR